MQRSTILAIVVITILSLSACGTGSAEPQIRVEDAWARPDLLLIVHPSGVSLDSERRRPRKLASTTFISFPFARARWTRRCFVEGCRAPSHR